MVAHIQRVYAASLAQTFGNRLPVSRRTKQAWQDDEGVFAVAIDAGEEIHELDILVDALHLYYS